MTKYVVLKNGHEVGRHRYKKDAVKHAGSIAVSAKAQIQDTEDGDTWTVTHDGKKPVLTPV